MPIQDESPGIIKEMEIDWKKGKGKFDIRMDKANLSGLTNQVTISLQIGDDFGKADVVMRVRWDYNAK